MELVTHKDKHSEYSYYLDKNGNEVIHGEYKAYHPNGQLWIHSFSYHGEWHGEYKYYHATGHMCERSCWYHGKRHGEYKAWHTSGKLISHYFYIDGEDHPYVEMADQEKLLFQIQHPGFRFIEE